MDCVLEIGSHSRGTIDKVSKWFGVDQVVSVHIILLIVESYNQGLIVQDWCSLRVESESI